MTNILVTGLAGGVFGVVLMASRIMYLLSILTQVVRNILQAPFPKFKGLKIRGVGFMFGCCFCHGSKVGFYHSLYLPLILIEMERGIPSLWGSVDQCTLVMVSAGICAANLINPLIIQKSKKSMCLRGFLCNILCGDFIEVAYPFMNESMIVNLCAYMASGIGTEILYNDHPPDVLSSAYLPLPISIMLAKDYKRLATSYLIAFLISFVGSLLSNLYKNTLQSKDKMDIHD